MSLLRSVQYFNGHVSSDKEARSQEPEYKVFKVHCTSLLTSNF
jgi:hypothetical protein